MKVCANAGGLLTGKYHYEDKDASQPAGRFFGNSWAAAYRDRWGKKRHVVISNVYSSQWTPCLGLEFWCQKPTVVLNCVFFNLKDTGRRVISMLLIWFWRRWTQCTAHRNQPWPLLLCAGCTTTPNFRYLLWKKKKTKLTISIPIFESYWQK